MPAYYVSRVSYCASYSDGDGGGKHVLRNKRASQYCKGGYGLALWLLLINILVANTLGAG